MFTTLFLLPKTMDDSVMQDITGKIVYSKLSGMKVKGRQFDNTSMHYVQDIPVMSLLRSFYISVNICCNVKDRFEYVIDMRDLRYSI